MLFQVFWLGSVVSLDSAYVKQLRSAEDQETTIVDWHSSEALR
jgi:hypothetical protein